MSFEESLTEIESHEFAARLNLASDFKTFYRGMLQERSVRDLSQELNSLEKRLRLFLRTIQLARQLVDPRFENQWDATLATYLWVIWEILLREKILNRHVMPTLLWQRGSY